MRKQRLFSFTSEVLKNLISKPATVNYPEEPATYPERMRGHIHIDIEQCISCTLCAQNCPPGALEVNREEGTWTIHRFDCIQCGNCVQICPKHCLHMEKGYTLPAQHKSSDTYTRPKIEKKYPQAGDACVYCGLCSKKCPQQAIQVERDTKTWKLNKERCVSCGICANSCPKKCIQF